MYVYVRVTAGQKREFVEVVRKNRFKIAVREPAERNLANRRVAALVAKHYKTDTARVRLISGHTSPAKIFSVDV